MDRPYSLGVTHREDKVQLLFAGMNAGRRFVPYFASLPDRGRSFRNGPFSMVALRQKCYHKSGFI